MTTIFETDSSPGVIFNNLSSNGVQASYNLLTGGYSVWDCAPAEETKPPAPVKKTP